MIDNTMLKHMAAEPAIEDPLVPEEEPPEQMTFFRVFTFPLSRPGLTVLGFYAVVPFLLKVLLILVASILPLLAFAMGFVAGLVNALISLSTFWYLTVCIRASAEGQSKAPDVFEFSQDDSFWGWLRQFFLIIVTVSLCIAPAFILRHFVEISEMIFWSILSVGIFLLPMCLLAMVIFDTINALNPVLIIASIFSTFFSYIGVVLLFCVPLLLIGGILSFSWNPWLSVPIRAMGLYLLMMDAYLLGWFFYYNFLHYNFN